MALRVEIFTQLFTAGFVLASLSAGALAADKVDIARCAAVENGVMRLECFDNLAKKLGVAEADTVVSKAGAWNVEVDTSPIDDKKNVYLSLNSNELIPSRFGTSSGRASLLLRCKESKTSAYVVWGNNYIGLERTSIEYRIDKNPVVNTRVGISTDGKATGFWSGGEAIPFIKKLLGKDQVLFRVTPHSESPVMVTFPISDLEAAIKPLREACKW